MMEGDILSEKEATYLEELEELLRLGLLLKDIDNPTGEFLASIASQAEKADMAKRETEEEG